MSEDLSKVRRYTNILAIIGLIGLILLFVAPALSPNKILAPLDIVSEAWPPWQKANQSVTVHNFALHDVVNYILPVKQFMTESLRGGEYPLWNPYVFTGYPFTYNTQAGLWYPLSLLYYALPLATAVDATVILQMSLGALFMFAFLRQIRLSTAAAFVGAVIYTFNGLMVVWLEWQVVQAAVLWLPLQLWLVERIAYHLEAQDGHTAVSRRRILSLSILAGLVFALPWLGGHWNWTLFTSLTVGVYLVWRLWPLAAQARGRQRGFVALPLLLTLGIGTAVALIQALPAFNYLAHTHRQPMTYAQALDFALWGRLVVMVVPNFFGNPAHNNWWGPQNYNETAFYLGLMPLLLAGLALWLRRDRWTVFFSIWAALGLLWALRTPLYWPLSVLPVFSGLFPSRAIFLTVVGVAVLAAVSVDRLQQPAGMWGKRPFLPLLFLCLALLALAGIYFWVYRADVGRTWAYLRPQTIAAAAFLLAAASLIAARLANRISPRLFVTLTLVCVVADLFWFGHDYNTIASLDDWFGQTAVADFLHADPTAYRIVTPAESIVYSPNTSLVDQIANVSGYEPGIWQRTADYVNLAEGESAIRFGRFLMPLRGLNSPLLDAINARYTVTTKNAWAAEPAVGPAQETATRWQALAPDAPVRQNLPMPDAGLFRLDVWLRPSPTADGVITGRIFTADGALELAHSDLEATAAVANAWNAFNFEAFPSEWGRDFLLEVSYAGNGEMQIGTDDDGRIAFRTAYLPRPNLVFEDGKSQIYRSPGAFERAYFVPQALVVESVAEGHTAVLAHADELDQLVILELMGQTAPPHLGQPANAAANIAIPDYSLNQVTITAVTDTDGFLVLSDTYYPGWRATLDGQATPVYQANTLVRAIYLPAGEHTAVFTFRPPDFIFAAAVSALTLLASLIALVILWRRRRKDA